MFQCISMQAAQMATAQDDSYVQSLGKAINSLKPILEDPTKTIDEKNKALGDLKSHTLQFLKAFKADGGSREIFDAMVERNTTARKSELVFENSIRQNLIMMQGARSVSLQRSINALDTFDFLENRFSSEQYQQFKQEIQAIFDVQDIPATKAITPVTKYQDILFLKLATYTTMIGQPQLQNAATKVYKVDVVKDVDNNYKLKPSELRIHKKDLIASIKDYFKRNKKNTADDLMKLIDRASQDSVMVKEAEVDGKVFAMGLRAFYSREAKDVSFKSFVENLCYQALQERKSEVETELAAARVVHQELSAAPKSKKLIAKEKKEQELLAAEQEKELLARQEADKAKREADNAMRLAKEAAKLEQLHREQLNKDAKKQAQADAAAFKKEKNRLQNEQRIMKAKRSTALEKLARHGQAENSNALHYRLDQWKAFVVDAKIEEQHTKEAREKELHAARQAQQEARELVLHEAMIKEKKQQEDRENESRASMFDVLPKGLSLSSLSSRSFFLKDTELVLPSNPNQETKDRALASTIVCNAIVGYHIGSYPMSRDVDALDLIGLQNSHTKNEKADRNSLAMKNYYKMDTSNKDNRLWVQEHLRRQNEGLQGACDTCTNLGLVVAQGAPQED